MKSEIYALTDPDSGEVRYIGKANCSSARLVSHLRDAVTRDTPVYRWVRKLHRAGKVPSLQVLACCIGDDWKAAERRLIAEYRARGVRLLNVAEGGDEPFCSPEVRASNGRAVARARVSTPQRKRFYELKRMLGQALKAGHVSEATRAKLRAGAAKHPGPLGCFASA